MVVGYQPLRKSSGRLLGKHSHWYKTSVMGLHLKSAQHLVQKPLPKETFLARNEGNLIRSSHLYLKARKIKWLSRGKAQSNRQWKGVILMALEEFHSFN